MDELIRELEQLTAEAIREIEEWTYEQWEQFVESRELLISALQKMPLTEVLIRKYEPAIKRLVSFDPMITARMAALKREATFELNRLESSRKQKSAYDGYNEADSIFFDQRK